MCVEMAAKEEVIEEDKWARWGNLCNVRIMGFWVTHTVLL